MAPHPHGPDDAAACCGCDGDCDRVLIDASDTRFPPARSRGDDEQPDQLERIDELITQMTRHDAFMPHRHIDRGVLFALLEHTCNVVLPVGIAVLSSGAFHVVQDVIHTVSWSGDLMVVSTRDAVIEVALAAVRSCVLVRLHGAHGPTSLLELYDADNSCVALISQFGIVGDRVHDAWEQITASLPEEA